jgi:hypothetical protein
MSEWVTIREAANQSGYAETTIQGMVHSKIISCVVRATDKKRRYVNIGELLAWRDREVFHKPLADSATTRIKQWLNDNRELIERSRYGDGRMIVERCCRELNITVHARTVLDPMNKMGIKLAKGHTEQARQFIKKHPWLIYEEKKKGWQFFIAETGIEINSRLWRQAIADYKESLKE